MRYILSVLPVIPIALLVSVAIYVVIYNVLKKKREKPDKAHVFVEIMLIGWGIMFIYVTQLMSFGNGMGARINMQPLRLFFTAFRYGSNNASGVWQFFLNIIMFVPLGFLYPIVFKKHRNWHSVLIVSFICTAATELVQLITHRGTDIDDIIANILGGLCGFAVYLILVGLVNCIKHRKVDISKYKMRLAIGFLIIALIAGVFGGLRLCDGSSKYGSLYYGHLMPTDVDIRIALDDRQYERPVYKYSEQVSLQDLENKLKSITGFEGDWKEENNLGETYYSLFGDDTQVVFIHPYNTWSVHYEYAVDSESKIDNPIDERVALDKAWEYLDSYDIGPLDVVYDEEIKYNFSDENYHFYFSPIETDKDTKIHGTVSLTIGKDGRLISISDDRIWCVFVENADCISQVECINITTEVGCGNWQEKAVVNGVEESFAFIPDTGYLIPTWKITGYLNADGGQQLEWIPEIDAVR